MDSGFVNNNSSVPCFFSSEKLRIVTAEIRNNKTQGANKKNEDKIQQKVFEKTRDLSQKEKEDIVRLANELETRQNAQDDPEILPKVTKEDIPLSRNYASPVITETNTNSNYFYKTGTNGIVYHSMLFPCDALNQDELSVANLFTSTLTDIGLGHDSYEDIQRYQSSNSLFTSLEITNGTIETQ